MSEEEPRRPRGADGPPEGVPVPFEPPPAAPGSPIEEALVRHRERLLAIDGVEGLDHGRGADGTEVIRVHIRTLSVKRRVPRELDGFPVITIVTGPYRAY
ncbi:hypothetical protein GCM10009736_19840 [Actinomadura bangladeshensis]